MKISGAPNIATAIPKLGTLGGAGVHARRLAKIIELTLQIGYTKYCNCKNNKYIQYIYIPESLMAYRNRSDPSFTECTLPSQNVRPFGFFCFLSFLQEKQSGIEFLHNDHVFFILEI